MYSLKLYQLWFTHLWVAKWVFINAQFFVQILQQTICKKKILFISSLINRVQSWNLAWNTRHPQIIYFLRILTKTS